MLCGILSTKCRFKDRQTAVAATHQLKVGVTYVLSYCPLNPSTGWTASIFSSLFPAQCSEYFLIPHWPSEAVSRKPSSVRLSLIIRVTFSRCTCFKPILVSVNEIENWWTSTWRHYINTNRRTLLRVTVTTCITLWMWAFQYLRYLHINYINCWEKAFLITDQCAFLQTLTVFHIYVHIHVDVRTFFALHFVHHEATYLLLFQR
jgi:hypothetical protein